MLTVLEKYYPVSVMSAIIANHLRVDEMDGELFEHAKMCVINAFEAAEDYTNRIIVESKVSIALDTLEDSIIELPSAPVREVSEVRYMGADDEWHMLTDYTLVSNNRRAILELRTMPTLSTTRSTGRVVIEAMVGYEDYPGDRAKATSPNTLPGGIEQAIMLMAGTFFEFTGDVVMGGSTEIPASAKSLLYPYRIHPYGS